MDTKAEQKAPLTLAPIAAGFDPASVRCAAESRLHDLILKDEDLLSRMKALTDEMEESRQRERIEMLTNDFRVDEAITPKLFHLGTMLTRILRIALPMDIFVHCSDELNAFCTASSKGKRLVMCLYSSLLASLSQQELLFVMGHEAGHALLGHTATPNISYDNPNFSPLEVIRLRALDRAQEVSCDRLGLLACQDPRVAASALFKISSGLTEKWMCFDESAYARHFDELSSMAELVDLRAADDTHPFSPLRAKALIAFARSESYCKAFGKAAAAISTAEMEAGVGTMLSVLDIDLSEWENAKEQDAAGDFIVNAALMLIASDGVVRPEKVAWLKAHTDQKWSRDELAEWMAKPEFHEQMSQHMEASADILRRKLPEVKRASLLHTIFDAALCGGALPNAEMEAIDRIRELLDIRQGIAKTVLNDSEKEHSEAMMSASNAAGASASARKRKVTGRGKKV